MTTRRELHERLPELACEISKRSGATNVQLDSFVISATPYRELCNRYGDGTWNRAAFAAKHILFPERNDEYDYLAQILQSAAG